MSDAMLDALQYAMSALQPAHHTEPHSNETCARCQWARAYHTQRLKELTMAEATIVRATPVTPPPVITLVLSVREAAILKLLTGSIKPTPGNQQKQEAERVWKALDAIPEVVAEWSRLSVIGGTDHLGAGIEFNGPPVDVVFDMLVRYHRRDYPHLYGPKLVDVRLPPRYLSPNDFPNTFKDSP
jgi:hypothetical protein